MTKLTNFWECKKCGRIERHAKNGGNNEVTQ